MSSRRKGRILAFQALYSWESNRSPSKSGDPQGQSVPDGLLDFSWSQKADGTQTINEETRSFSRLLVSGTLENITDVDLMIQKHLKNWNIERLNLVDMAILRMSVYTLMYQSDMPATIVIDEAICIAKEFGTDDSYRFVNGVLDAINKTITQGGVSDKIN